MIEILWVYSLWRLFNWALSEISSGAVLVVLIDVNDLRVEECKDHCFFLRSERRGMHILLFFSMR